jgi:DUF971 family protein
MPEQVALHESSLELSWSERTVVLSAPALRARCRCAPCRARERRGEASPTFDAIRLVALEEVGGYALNLRFSDGHDRGIYPWTYLRELALAEADLEG